MRLLGRAECQERLQLLFPEELPRRGRLTNLLAASAVFVFLYVGSVEGERQIRPSMALWMCDRAAQRARASERRQWYEAAARGKRALADLLASWGVPHQPWYGDNTREPLRDETFRGWAQYGAVLRDETVPTTSPAPSWSLAADFAAVFDPRLRGDSLADAIEDWRQEHLGAAGLARVAVAQQLAGLGGQVFVELPGGARRTLAPGGSSLILKGVIEQLAPRLLERPGVLFLSESREHVDVVDARLLRRLGISVDAARLLPDALLFDAGPGTFWLVEAVYTAGAIDEARKEALSQWSSSQSIDPDCCRYLSAFVSRTASPFRQLVSSLAWGTHVWFLDEPEQVMRLEDLPERGGV
jgi:hypothetical protein